MENLSEKNEEVEQENVQPWNVEGESTNEVPLKRDDKVYPKHHHHGHPHVVTIGHNSHGRSNSRSFGVDHEPGSRL
ncbi:hypothetical protein [Desertivirga arenae]|uniref:hypothetical protein n=1 Tax=Desertivirga arenae TaxID=2810309 RepID=UPI001A965C46|nr:hypothetical protein [Pedobacter sp. SYSU D00823]